MCIEDDELDKADMRYDEWRLEQMDEIQLLREKCQQLQAENDRLRLELANIALGIVRASQLEGKNESKDAIKDS